MIGRLRIEPGPPMTARRLPRTEHHAAAREVPPRHARAAWRAEWASEHAIDVHFAGRKMGTVFRRPAHPALGWTAIDTTKLCARPGKLYFAAPERAAWQRWGAPGRDAVRRLLHLGSPTALPASAGLAQTHRDAMCRRGGARGDNQ